MLLTLGPMIAEDEMRRCMATGADDLYQINVNWAPALKQPIRKTPSISPTRGSNRISWPEP